MLLSRHQVFLCKYAQYSDMPVTDNHFRGKSKYGIKGAVIMFLEVKSTLIHLK